MFAGYGGCFEALGFNECGRTVPFVERVILSVRYEMEPIVKNLTKYPRGAFGHPLTLDPGEVNRRLVDDRFLPGAAPAVPVPFGTDVDHDIAGGVLVCLADAT